MATAAALIQFALISIGAFASHVSPLARNSYVRFDSNHYLSIAAGGYKIAYCAPGNTTEPIEGEPRPGGMNVYCGNAGWFPGYSYLVAALSRLGVEIQWAGMAVSWLLRWLGLLLVAAELRRRKVATEPAAATMLAAAAFPGCIYYAAIFPVALLSLSLLLLLRCVEVGHMLRAGFAAFAAALAHSFGWTGPAAVSALLVATALPAGNLRAISMGAVILGGAILAGVSVIAIQMAQTGIWNAYFLQQSTFVHTLGPSNLLQHLQIAATSIWTHPLEANTARYWQLYLVLVWLAAAVIAVARLRDSRRGPLVVVVALACATWIVPKMFGQESAESQVRYESLMLPLVLAIPVLHPALRWSLVVASVALAPITASLFFNSVLV